MRPIDENHKLESLLALYTENAETVRAFWEWRHKVITIYFATLGAIFFLSDWMLDNTKFQGHKYLWLIFVLGAFFTLAIALMERTNRLVLAQCYALGQSIEQQVREGGGIFCRIRVIANDPWIYTKVLKWLYPSTAVLLLVAAAASALWWR